VRSPATTRLLAVALLATASCSGVSEIRSAPRNLGGDEPQRVRKKADQALAEAKYAVAWDTEAEAGADRDRLEAIMLASLSAGRGPYEAMLAELRRKFGGLSPGARARVDALAREREAAGRWTDAVDVQIVAADDPPAFAAAWGVHERAPPRDALAVLQRIQDARDEHAKASEPAKPAEQPPK
jgi:hypothetical protein